MNSRCFPDNLILFVLPFLGKPDCQSFKPLSIHPQILAKSHKLVVFDEAHEYVDSKELVGELENAITQIRHDGLSFILASQFPERIPEEIFRYLVTRLIFKLPTGKAITYLHRAATNLAKLSAHEVSNLDLEQGVCFVQTDDDCTDTSLRAPQRLQVRPRLTHHGGATVRQTAVTRQPFVR